MRGERVTSLLPYSYVDFLCSSDLSSWGQARNQTHSKANNSRQPCQGYSRSNCSNTKMELLFSLGLDPDAANKGEL